MAKMDQRSLKNGEVIIQIWSKNGNATFAYQLTWGWL